jgi:transcriptional regulator with XRE-family HTH domain
MPNPKEETLLRQKILGVKVRYARLRAGLSLEEVGQPLSFSAEVMNEIELGQRNLSLPQLEIIALRCHVPVIYFRSDQPESADNPFLDFPVIEAIMLRQRIIGALLRKARLEAGYSQEDLANLLELPVSQISEYEFGTAEIPVPQLEVLANHLNLSLTYFLDQSISANRTNGQVATLDEITRLSELPKNIREFLTNPANLLYVTIAMRLSNVSAETLRALAEGLLEVTY